MQEQRVMKIAGENITVSGRLVRIGRLEAEGFEFVKDPDAILTDLVKVKGGMDLFTFLQRLPATTAEYDYPMERDNVAAMPVSTFEHWWTWQINGKTRNMIRRSAKKGLELREVAFDDALVRGIWEIYNECPVRQGRPFPHYGKDINAVRQMSSTFLDSSTFIGAFLKEKLIGFVKLTTDEARSQAAVMHIISLIEHREKAPMNALIAESVKACEKRALPYLVYSKFSYWKKQRDSLSDFKERNGFRRYDVPRYYVPLTRLGRFAFHLGLQHGVLDSVPEPVVATLRRFRDMRQNRKSQSAGWTF
jgi:hypothetical protein